MLRVSHFSGIERRSFLHGKCRPESQYFFSKFLDVTLQCPHSKFQLDYYFDISKPRKCNILFGSILSEFRYRYHPFLAYPQKYYIFVTFIGAVFFFVFHLTMKNKKKHNIQKWRNKGIFFLNIQVFVSQQESNDFQESPSQIKNLLNH